MKRLVKSNSLVCHLSHHAASSNAPINVKPAGGEAGHRAGI